MVEERYRNFDSISTQSLDCVAAVPSDSVTLPYYPKALYIGGAGNLAVTMQSGNVTFVGLAAGSILPIRPSAILATGTTATDIVILY